jgi:hypothetical protein
VTKSEEKKQCEESGWRSRVGSKTTTTSTAQMCMMRWWAEVQVNLRRERTLPSESGSVAKELAFGTVAVKPNGSQVQAGVGSECI